MGPMRRTGPIWKTIIWPARRKGSVVVDVQRGDLALNDLEKGKVGITESWTTIDEGRTTGGDLAHPLGDEIDEDRILFDMLGGFFDEVSSHKIKGARVTGGRRVVVSREVANEMWPDLRLM